MVRRYVAVLTLPFFCPATRAQIKFCFVFFKLSYDYKLSLSKDRSNGGGRFTDFIK